MNYRIEIIKEALKQGFPVPVDMVLELTDAGIDITDIIDNIDGFTVEEF